MCGHALWNWRLTTDVDFYTRFSGFSKWQIYSIRTFKFYCRLSHLVTSGWLSVKHLHSERGLERWGTAAASPSSRCAWPRAGRGQRRARPALLPAGSRGSWAAAPGTAPLSAWQQGPRRQPQSFFPSLPVRGPRQERGSGAERPLPGLLFWERAASYGGVHGDGSCCRCFLLLSLPCRTWLTKFAFLMLKWVCGKCCNTLSGKVSFEPIGDFRELWKGRWGEGKQMTASSRLASKLMPHGSQMTEHSCMVAWSHYSHPH